MALRALVLKKKIDAKNKQLAELRNKLEELSTKDEEFNKREAELAQAVEEITEEISEEDKKLVEDEVANFDATRSEHEEAKANLSSEVEKLETEIKDNEAELAEVETEASEGTQPTEEEKPVEEVKEEKEERKVNFTMNKRFNEWSVEERSAFVAKDEVKAFIDNFRALARGEKMNTRGLTGADLLIPETFLGIVKAEAEQYSKLLKHVNVKKVSGTSRAVVEGDIPEAIWMEACDVLKELNLAFTGVEMDAYKVGGYIPVCNANLDDADIDLASEIATALGQGIGYALDKAIVYGTGSKMPTGFASTATKSTVTSTDGKKLFQGIAKACASLNHANGELVWVMNSATKMTLVAEALDFNANGAIVTGVSNTMPVVGGAIEVLDFVPDNEVLGGYGLDYVVAERSGATIARSEHAMFVQDKTVFKGTARYDGKPAYTDGFVAIGLGAAPTATIDSAHPFAE